MSGRDMMGIAQTGTGKTFAIITLISGARKRTKTPTTSLA
jgi:superfamily II DNA/RNA helicase